MGILSSNVLRGARSGALCKPRHEDFLRGVHGEPRDAGVLRGRCGDMRVVRHEVRVCGGRAFAGKWAKRRRASSDGCFLAVLSSTVFAGNGAGWGLLVTQMRGLGVPRSTRHVDRPLRA